MFNQLRMLVVQQLKELDDAVRLVVVHPNYAQQHVVLGEFLEQQAHYVRFEGHRLSRTELRAQVNAAIESQTGKSNRKDTTVLILDECDRAAPVEFDAFLPQIVSEGGKGRVIIFSRHMPQCVLTDSALRKQTTFIPDDSSFMLWDYARRNDDAALLEVRAFGEGRVLLNGQKVDDWDGLLPRSLFFYLVDRGMTTRNEIFETFWPTLPVREATNVFHVTKRKISEVLGIDLTTYWSGFYRISPNIQLSYDVVLFTEIVQNSAVASAPETETLLARAAALYQGHFLTAMEMEWSQKRRNELAQNYGEVLAGLAKAKEDTGDGNAALGLYLRAVANNRQREDLILSVMRLYREKGHFGDALTVYNRHAKELKAELGVDPAPQLQEMAASIRQQPQQ